MNEVDLIERTKMFALRIIKLVNALPNTIVGRAMGGQLIRSGTSVGANYRAACRGRSKAEFIAKMGTVVEESDECADWLDLIAEAAVVPRARVQSQEKEADELTSIFTASRKTAMRNLRAGVA